MNPLELSQLIADKFDDAKLEGAPNLYNHIKSLAPINDIPWKSHYAFGWIIYYALHQSDSREIASRKQMLADYLKLRLVKPHKLHSMVLTEAIRLYKDAVNFSFGKQKEEAVTFSFLRFFDLWGIENLRPNDWNRKVVADKTLSSTVEKLMTVMVNQLEAERVAPKNEYVAIADRAVDLYNDSSTVFAQRAAMHALEGNREAHREMLTKALLISPHKFHLWSRLADTVDAKANPNLYVSLLYKALSSPGQEDFKGKIRLQLSKFLADNKAYPQALWELNRVKETYTAKEWHLPKDFEAVLSSIPADTQPSDPKDIYRKVAHLADDVLYSNLPAVVMEKIYHKEPTPEEAARFRRPEISWKLGDSQGNSLWIKPRRHGIDPMLPKGTLLEVKIFNGKIVKANKH